MDMTKRALAALILGSCSALSPAPSRAALGASARATGCGAGLSERAAVTMYYALVDAHQFTAAYQCFSTGYRARVTFTAWRKGYAATVHTALSNTPVRIAPAVIRFTLLATDAVNGHRVFSRFTGTWRLVDEQGWRLDRATVHLIARHTGPSLDFTDRLLTQTRRVAGTFSPKLPAFLPYGPHGLAWQVASIPHGVTITLAQGAPVSDANTVFTESAVQGSPGENPADKTVALADGSSAAYYEPFAHGGNGQPSLSWANGTQQYTITYACSTNCLQGLERIANSMAPTQG